MICFLAFGMIGEFQELRIVTVKNNEMSAAMEKTISFHSSEASFKPDSQQLVLFQFWSVSQIKTISPYSSALQHLQKLISEDIILILPQLLSAIALLQEILENSALMTLVYSFYVQSCT